MSSPRPTGGRHRAPRAGGRHRRPTRSRAPAYVTAATLAAFAVSGINVQGAIGDSRVPEAAAAVEATAPSPRALTSAAAALRARSNDQSVLRASRVRGAKAKADVDERVRVARQKKRTAARKAEAARPKWVRPLAGFRWSAGFGATSYLWSNRHTGQDLSAPYGAKIFAVADGRIISAGWDGAYGNKIAIKHDDGTESWYAHLSSFERRSGWVSAGAVIGRVGSTGNSTGSHLHLEIRPNGGNPIEPMGWLRRHGVKI